jgi:lysophospholipase L1-like esterase
MKSLSLALWALLLLTATDAPALVIRAALPPATTARNLHVRPTTANSATVFTQTKKGHVAFIGGSITEMNGYRPMIATALKKRFPQTEFTFTNAGIASTCSTTGAHRLTEDVLSKGPVDLFFVEFAVNDDQDAHHAKREAMRGLEGIIRQCRKHNPRMDIIVTYFVNEGMLDTFIKGKVPIAIEAHEAVCEHYGVSTVDLAKEASQLIAEKKLDWKTYGGTHPGPTGNALAAQMCMQLLELAWKDAPVAATDYKLPEKPLDEGNYEGRFIEPKEAVIDAAWTVDVPNWKAIPGSFRDTFAGKPVLHSATPGAEAAVTFEGKAIGVYVLAGPDAGILEVRIDGGQWNPVNLYHPYSGGLHYPRTVMLATDLKPGRHTAVIRISAEHDKASKGTAARILKFAVN